jgi:hypothetical protein
LGALSDALETTFLPFRRYVLGRHLCLQPTPAVASAAVAAAEDAAIMPGDSGSMRFVDAVIADFLETGAAAEAAAASPAEADRLMEAIDRLPAADRAIVREKVRDQIAQARESERQRPGAFVEVRRPHRLSLSSSASGERRRPRLGCRRLSQLCYWTHLIRRSRGHA